MFATLVAALIVAQATPVPTPTGPCSHEAEIVKPVAPDWPSGLPLNTPPFVVQVSVLVAADGSVESTSMWQSSSYPAANAATVKAAIATTYKPKLLNCKPVEGRYLFRADFSPH